MKFLEFIVIISIISKVKASCKIGSTVLPGTVTFNKSSKDQLCKLVTISSDGSTIVPVGRSYNSGEWEAVAGPYVSLSYSCNENTCFTELPIIDNDASYEVLEFTYSTSKRNNLARFLEQATFGATRKELDKLDVSNELADHSIGLWVEDQINNVPMSLHREYYRKRVNHRFPQPYSVARPHSPCEESTRYRRAAFSSKDRDKELHIKQVNGKFTLSVDGYIRTVVDNIEWEQQGYINEFGKFKYTNLVTRICWVEDGLYSYMEINDVDNGNCVPIVCGDNEYYCNPPIEFDSSIASPAIVISLAQDRVKSINKEKFWSGSNQELLVTSTLTDDQCADLSVQYNNIPVFGLHSSYGYYIHDAPPFLLKNTLKTPLQDGGSNSKFFSRGVTECSNTPRTFLNSDSCQMSTDISACRSNDVPTLSIKLNEKNIRSLYTVSRDDPAMNTRYVYVVDGLRIESDSATEAPCLTGSYTRWLRLDKSIPCNEGNLKGATKSSLRDRISASLYWLDEGSDAPNLEVVDVLNWWNECHPDDFDEKGMEIEVFGVCYLHVHQHHLNVYDMTYWTLSFTHPGNQPDRNPIKEFAENGETTLMFPSWHTMDRWTLNNAYLTELGKLGDIISFGDLPSALQTYSIADTFGGGSIIEQGAGVIVCGSPGEVGNDPSLEGGEGYGAFDVAVDNDESTTSTERFKTQRKTVWTMIAFEGKDQLRQRIAWALNQILAIAAPSIESEINTEKFVTYYDIFVRNAFGNYRDILKEISFSDSMAENLSFLGSRSTAINWEWEEIITYPDENFAREIMQLFSIGLCKLNIDGTTLNHIDGSCIPTYSNDDIEEYARVWTGFERRKRRGNIESEDDENHIDPMKIVLEYRDKFPKMGLNGQYIGDKIPLCADRPKKSFLKKGAKFILLGSSSSSEHLTDPSSWASNPNAIRLSTGKCEIKKKKKTKKTTKCLYNQLCNPDNKGKCNYKNVVTLTKDVACMGNECEVDMVRVIEVEKGIFYEHIPEPCVEQAYFSDSKKIVNYWGGDQVCADPRRDIASTACCTESGEWVDAKRKEIYWGERMTFDTAKKRCSAENKPLCDYPTVYDTCITEIDGDEEMKAECQHEGYYWTTENCDLRVKVNPDDGKIFIVHSVPESQYGYNDNLASHVGENTLTYFRVHWEDPQNIPTPQNNCGGGSDCSIFEGMCVCKISINDDLAFSSMPSRENILQELHIGAFSPVTSGLKKKTKQNDVTVFYKKKSKQFSMDSIFEVTNDAGTTLFLKNQKSTVQIVGTSMKFRNPPHFLNLGPPNLLDAEYETDAAFDHYFTHPNMPPFLARRLIQRFGISNPSPQYIQNVASAFKSGTYEWISSQGKKMSFGSKNYGSLESTVASILLHREARSPVLDADSSHGTSREPLLKVIGFLRSMEFALNSQNSLIEFKDLKKDIGMMVYDIPTVFSFFSPDYQSAGPVASSSLVSPEAQVLNGPTLLGTTNGLFSLIKWGLSHIWDGLAYAEDWEYWWYNEDVEPGDYSESIGRLTFTPESNDPEKVVDEISTLLTGGRLSSESKSIIKDVYSNEQDKDAALKMVQQLFVTAPEFHTTSLTRKSGSERESYTPPEPSGKSKKFIVLVFLDGGFDSFNMLVPECNPLKSQYESKRAQLSLSSSMKIPITASKQPCDEFAVHANLDSLAESYNNGDTLFIANTGVLNTAVTRDNYWELTKTELFAHNTMNEESQRVDPYASSVGTGVLGRLLDVLATSSAEGGPYNVGAISIETGSPSLNGKSGNAPIIVSTGGTKVYDPKPWDEFRDYRDVDLFSSIQAINEANTADSSVYGETYSSTFLRVIAESEFLANALENAELSEPFEETYFSEKLAQVAKLIKTANERGLDRESFFVEFGGWDHHDQLHANIDPMFTELNAGLKSFWKEMKNQGREKDVTLLCVSEFARTLTPNSSQGSDHAWGGHYFMMGGSVKGKQIVGSYPDDLDGPLNVDSKSGRARYIPSSCWDSIWNAISQEMGVRSEADLDYILPNRQNCGSPLFKREDLFS